jgi:hypothetical protein
MVIIEATVTLTLTPLPEDGRGALYRNPCYGVCWNHGDETGPV